MKREIHNVFTVGTFFLLFLEYVQTVVRDIGYAHIAGTDIIIILEYAHIAERDILNPCDET